MRPDCVDGVPGEHEDASIGRGRVLRARLGINPNSSGHGILWGAMFFLPLSVAGALLAGAIETWLNRALKEERGGMKR
ncbi:MAG: hypothetical protein AB1497_01480 [Bacillota bacterium]